MIDWTQGAICLVPTGNLQGYYAFLSLRTGRKITCSQFTELTTPQCVTQRVISMAMHENQQKGLVFEDHNGVELPMLDGDVLDDGAGATVVDIGNIANHMYLEYNPYRELANDDDNDEDDDIELVVSPAGISETIIYADEESTEVVDEERTGVATSEDREITGLPNTED